MGWLEDMLNSPPKEPQAADVGGLVTGLACLIIVCRRVSMMPW
jgi:hypothetical protein